MYSNMLTVDAKRVTFSSVYYQQSAETRLVIHPTPTVFLGQGGAQSPAKDVHLAVCRLHLALRVTAADGAAGDEPPLTAGGWSGQYKIIIIGILG